MKMRIWVSLTLAISVFVLAVSGFLLFFLPYSRSFETVHSVFGFLFSIAVVPHIVNNLKSLATYFRKQKKAK